MLDIDGMLAKCGDFNRYQYMLMGIFCIVNILSSMHYYSQTIISFVPEHWCYSSSLSNLTISEIRDAYSVYDDPYCSPFNEDQDGVCKKWIYNFDFGYKSMTSDVSLSRNMNIKKIIIKLKMF